MRPKISGKLLSQNNMKVTNNKLNGQFFLQKTPPQITMVYNFMILKEEEKKN